MSEVEWSQRCREIGRQVTDLTTHNQSGLSTVRYSKMTGTHE